MFNPVTIFGITMPLISVILVGVAIAVFVIIQVARSSIANRLEGLFANKLYDEYLTEIDEPITRFFIPDFNREYLRLNGYIATGDIEKTSATFDRLLSMRTMQRQRDDLLFRAFQFYMQQEMFDDAKAVLDEMKASKRNAERIETCEQTWEIFGNGSYAYIEQMEAEIDDAPYTRKVSYALMLATQYANKKDDKKSEMWQERAREYVENMPAPGSN